MKKVLLFVSLAMLVLLQSCERKAQVSENSQIAVFVPGFLEGSPSYEMMDAGVRRAAEEAGVQVNTLEGGFNQGEWKDKVMALASEQAYDLIVTTNPAMPEICEQVAQEFPGQIFLCLDGTDMESDNLISLVYNHMEQAFIIGHLAGLVTQSEMEGANEDLKVGMIVGQLYPDMERAIKPGFEIGMKTVIEDGELDFRVLGNWYDAAKAAEMARSMFDDGVDVILTIAGGGNQGVLTAAKEAGKYVLWFDSPATEMEPGVILASSEINQEEMSYQLVDSYLKGDLDEGTVLHGGLEAGYILFNQEDHLYQKHVPQEIRQEQENMLRRMMEGQLSLSPLN